MPHILAVILDLDGVITHTAGLHATAWKQLFDSYNERRITRGEPGFDPFTTDRDYQLHVDGKPRQDGVRDFLASRGINLPAGTPDDPPNRESLHGLANLKNTFFTAALQKQGPEVFPDSVAALRRWRAEGLKLAVASSSKNCEEVLKIAGLDQCFDTRVDGTHLQAWNMAGKPAPDIFLAAARELQVDPNRAAVVEDAIAGVQAAVSGHFGLVVGVSRFGLPKESLKAAGADLVVSQLTEITLDSAPGLRTRLAEERAERFRRHR